MTSALLLRGGLLLECANACREIIKSASSKLEALQMISDLAANRLEEYHCSAASQADEVAVCFTRLLDQIVFELTENLPADAAVREYVVTDLYTRLGIYLDVFAGREAYAGNLNKRLLTHEDTVIIRQCRLREYVPLLVSEFAEQPLLQKSIIRCLVSFDTDDILDFYYTVAIEPGSQDVKSMALVGLKKYGPTFRRWDLAGADDGDYGRLVAYARSFDGVSLEKNPLPAELGSLMFALQFIEAGMGSAINGSSIGWIMSVLGSVPGMGYFNSCLNDLYELLCSIILNAGRDSLMPALHDDDMTKALVAAVDFLPREYFDRISPLISLMGDDLINRVGVLMAAGRIRPDERESNILGFMLWKRGNNL